MAFSLTKALLASSPSAFSQATQSVFLTRAAHGKVPKSTLGTWLANDRLYIHGYLRAIGRQLSLLALPATVSSSGTEAGKGTGTETGTTPNERLLKWMIDALVNAHREEAFFVDTARRYGIEINLATEDGGQQVLQSAKLEGLVRFEALFDGLAPRQQQQQQQQQQADAPLGPHQELPWLEFAVVLWGTEKCYLEAWTGVARAQQELQQGPEAVDEAGDLDGGALRREFIANWSSAEFVEFVDRLGDILDDAVGEELRRREGADGDDKRERIMERAMGKWRELLDAERTFWPAMA